MFHHFGGNLGLYGRFRYVNEEIVKARNAPNTTMTGIGLTMEGINQNYFLYELVAETAWRNDPVDPYLWIEQFVRRRYGLNESSFFFSFFSFFLFFFFLFFFFFFSFFL